ncbi:MAG: ribosome assembly RNA-binding protein YhbY [Thauera propionica]|jgi:putative YhbY family RNA-binding protein|uniref:RNA-binding protein n=1 Tax=Thauera propionica TaxID=2019431 RepID=A0A235EW27_9RHOO|nr:MULTISPECIES: ribosome assembly RNA-binding protein YhbY [Thauera]MDD3675546.1 ribosome assembly RNA-binding protein YhbY [Thauera propionica]MDY0046272.1 ribosome assembly RNA-binding protein YhbY [Thauera propionica]OYD53191.1 RNA-binding protein [Thauera propionica]
MIELTPVQRRDLRARAHHLNPVVTIAGNGLTPTVVAEIERSLQAHELIKVKVQGTEREQRDALMSELCATLDAAPVQHIGNILVVWRQRREEAKDANPTTQKSGARPSTAKSAAAFAAAARRAALAKASAEARRSPARAPASRGRGPGSGTRGR